MTRDFFYIISMNKIQETYQKLIDTIIKFEDDNKDLFEKCYSARFLLKKKVLGCWWDWGETKRALEGIKSVGNDFLAEDVSEIRVKVYPEINHKTTSGNIKHHRPELRIYFAGRTSTHGWKDDIGLFWHHIWSDTRFSFQTFWIGTKSNIPYDAGAIVFLTWVVKQLPEIKKGLEDYVKAEKELKDAQNEYNNTVCEYAMSILNK